MPRKQPDERQMIEALCRELNRVIDATNATPGCRTVAAIMTAARQARLSSMPAPVGAAMIAEYIIKGDPV